MKIKITLLCVYFFSLVSSSLSEINQDLSFGPIDQSDMSASSISIPSGIIDNASQQAPETDGNTDEDHQIKIVRYGKTEWLQELNELCLRYRDNSESDNDESDNEIDEMHQFFDEFANKFELPDHHYFDDLYENLQMNRRPASESFNFPTIEALEYISRLLEEEVGFDEKSGFPGYLDPRAHEALTAIVHFFLSYHSLNYYTFSGGFSLKNIFLIEFLSRSAASKDDIVEFQIRDSNPDDSPSFDIDTTLSLPKSLGHEDFMKYLTFLGEKDKHEVTPNILKMLFSLNYNTDSHDIKRQIDLALSSNLSKIAFGIYFKSKHILNTIEKIKKDLNKVQNENDKTLLEDLIEGKLAIFAEYFKEFKKSFLNSIGIFNTQPIFKRYKDITLYGLVKDLPNRIDGDVLPELTEYIKRETDPSIFKNIPPYTDLRLYTFAKGLSAAKVQENILLKIMEYLKKRDLFDFERRSISEGFISKN